MSPEGKSRSGFRSALYVAAVLAIAVTAASHFLSRPREVDRAVLGEPSRAAARRAALFLDHASVMQPEASRLAHRNIPPATPELRAWLALDPAGVWEWVRENYANLPNAD